MSAISGDVHDDVLPSDRVSRRDLDVGQLWSRIAARRWWLIAPTLACLLGSTIFVNVVPPRYTAETKILLENQENFLTRSDKVDAQPLPDDEAVQSQVQLVSSRDLARAAIRQLGLQGNPEFDPLAKGLGPITRLLVLLGVERDPMRVPPEERMLDSYFDKLTVFPVTKSRVLTVEFDSEDPDLAARAANTVASLYIDIQSSAKRDAARSAADSLRSLIASLRSKAAEAEAKAQNFRSQSGLVLSANNATITSQQLTDMSTQLAQARSAEAESQAKAKLIREMIKAGRIGEIPDVANNELIRRMSEQRANVQAEIALQSRTLLPGHPRMQELTAQLADLDRQARTTAEKAARTLDNDAQIAANRVTNLNVAIGTQKDAVGASGGDQVKLNELDLNARLIKDQLELNTAKYQEAVARESAVSTPADARVISRAVAPQDASFPKKLPIVAIFTIAGALLSLGLLIAREFLSGRALSTDGHDLPLSVRTERRADDEDAAVVPNAPTGPEPDHAAALRSTLHAQDDPSLAGRDPFLAMLDRVLDLKQPNRALRLLVCDSDPDGVAGPLAMRVGRLLSRSFRVIAIECAGEAVPADDARRIERIAGSGIPHTLGFSDLLNGQASFAEVIHRDAASRLHYVAGVLPAEAVQAGQDGLANLLDALAETYDFVITTGPGFRDAAPASVLVDHTDLVIVDADASLSAERADVIRSSFAAPGSPAVVVLNDLDLKLADPLGAAA